MNRIWIVVANQAEAQIYSATKLPGELALLDTLTHTEGRAHARDLLSDAPGRVHDSSGPGRHSMEPATGVREEGRQRFARTIVERLETARQRGDFDQLVLMAAPAMLGVLRKTLTAGLEKTVLREIPRDMIGHDVAKIRAQLD